MKNNRTRRIVALALFVATSCCFLSCSKPRPDGLPPLVSCKITVTQDSQPLADATVSLYSDDVPWAVGGTTDASGVAVIYTHGQYAGAPEGNYVVTVTKQVVEQAEVALSPSVMTQGGKAYDLVEEQYGSRDKSPLTLEVSGKTTEKFDVGAAVRNEVKAM